MKGITMNEIDSRLPSSIGGASVITQSGYVIDPESDVWVLDKDITIHLGFMHSLNTDTAEFFRKTLIEKARIYRPSTVKNSAFYIRRFSKLATSLNSKSFFKYVEHDKDKLHPTANNFKALILFGYEFGFGGVPVDLIEILKEVNLGKSDCPAELTSVVNQDVYEGPFSDIELGNVMAQSLEEYLDKRISLESYSALMFFAETGRRSIQCSDIKIKDLFEKLSDDGIKSYFINVPRRKQRNQTFRDQFNPVPITEDLWILLSLQSASVKQKVIDKLVNIEECILDELPLFLKDSKLHSIKSEKHFAEVVSGDYLHKRGSDFGDLITDTAEMINVTSERTGEPLNITPKRFRHTIGTNAAREGYGHRVIAEILDHTTDVVAGDYVKNMPDIVDRLDRAMAYELAPLAQAFIGTVVSKEAEAVRGDDPSSRIRNEDGVYGSCGSYGFCSASAPIACYTCRNFQPWLDAPHEQVLDRLVRERDRMKDVTGDMRIASVNDRLIIAVAEVVQRCEQEKAKRLK